MEHNTYFFEVQLCIQQIGLMNFAEFQEFGRLLGAFLRAPHSEKLFVFWSRLTYLSVQFAIN